MSEDELLTAIAFDSSYYTPGEAAERRWWTDKPSIMRMKNRSPSVAEFVDLPAFELAAEDRMANEQPDLVPLMS